MRACCSRAYNVRWLIRICYWRKVKILYCINVIYLTMTAFQHNPGITKKMLHQLPRFTSYWVRPCSTNIASYDYISRLLCFSWFGRTPNRLVLPMPYVKTTGLSYPSNTIQAATWLISSRKTSFLRLRLPWDQNGLRLRLNLLDARHWLLRHDRMWRRQQEWLR